MSSTTHDFVEKFSKQRSDFFFLPRAVVDPCYLKKMKKKMPVGLRFQCQSDYRHTTHNHYSSYPRPKRIKPNSLEKQKLVVVRREVGEENNWNSYRTQSANAS